MSVEDTVKHCIENSLEEDWSHSIEESKDNENVVILHAHSGFLTSDLTEELRKRLIFVDATSSSYKEDHSTMYFLHYLESEEDTFMEALAEPISTDNNIDAVTREIAESEIDETNSHRFNLGFIAALNFVRERTSKDGDWESLPADSLPILQNFREENTEDAQIITEEELEQVEERLEGSAQELFQRLVENALDREKFHEIFNEDYGGADHTKIRKALQEVGDYNLMDIRRREWGKEHVGGVGSD